MIKKSPQYPQVPLYEGKNFTVNVYEKAGDSTPLQRSDLSKYGQVPVRNTDAYTTSAKLYGWMTAEYGKGSSPIGSICTILRKPQGNEEKQCYLDAFSKPEIYQKIISEYQRKPVPFEGLEIYLIRTHHFSDVGAKLCATVFLENARFLGLINDDGIFNPNDEVTINPPSEEKIKRPKPTSSPRKQATVQKGKGETQTAKHTPPVHQEFNQGDNTGRTITIFIKGKRFSWNIPPGMHQSDWDDIEVQIKQLKEVAKQ
jgi:hypothetical protein